MSELQADSGLVSLRALTTLIALLGCSLAAASGAHAAGEQRLVVGFAPDSSARGQRAALAAAGASTTDRIAPIDIATVRASASEARVLSRDPRVEYVVPDVRMQATFIPDDPLLGSQWAPGRINLPAAWDATTAASGPIIAVVDSGVDYTHPDLAAQMVTNPLYPGAGQPPTLGWDFVGLDNDPADVHGHGTHVAGIAAAATDNGQGIAGVAPGARIMAVRVLDENGSGWMSDIAQGVVWAADNGAEVINLSLGGDSGTAALQDALRYARLTGGSDDQGSVVVCASGNDGDAAVSFPARFDECLAVGASTETDQKAAFSNWGPELDVVAPGVDIHSTVMGASYESWSGTSMAAPVVAGVAALLADMGKSRASIETVLRQSATDLGTPGFDATTGHGRLDALSAVQLAVSGGGTPSCPAQPALRLTEDASVSFTPSCADIEDATLRLEIVRPPARGTASVAGQSITYAGGANLHGNDSFSFRAVDSSGRASVPVETTAIVSSVPDAPVCSPVQTSVFLGSDVDVEVACSDVEGAALYLTLYGAPGQGTLSSLSGTRIRYHAPPRGTGTVSFLVAGTDGSRTSAPVALTISLRSAAAAPLVLGFEQKGRPARCGSSPRAACVAARSVALAGKLRSTTNLRGARVRLAFFRQVGRRWVAGPTVATTLLEGNSYRVQVARKKLRRGVWRVRATSAANFSTKAAASPFRYLRVR